MRTTKLIRSVAVFGVIAVFAVGCSKSSKDTTAAPETTAAAAEIGRAHV